MLEVPDLLRRTAIAEGQAEWLNTLPALVASIEDSWSITVGPTLGGHEAYVAEAMLADGTPAVLKLQIPRYDAVAVNEIKALRIANGEGCVRLLHADESRFAMLTERLGRPLFEQKLPIDQRHEILTSTVMQMWRPAPDCGLPTGAEKGRWLIDFILEIWDELGRPCSSGAVEYAIQCAERRIVAHDDARAVLVHGDVHEWNTLEAGDGFKLVDPDGLLAEPEYDMGILMRGDAADALQHDPMDRARWLAARTGLDVTAIWEWGAVERLSTGLLCTKMGMQPEGSDMLEVAELTAT